MPLLYKGWRSPRMFARFRKDTPGAGFKPSSLVHTTGPYAGYSHRARLADVRKSTSRSRVTRPPVGGGPQARGILRTGTGVGQSRYAPKRLWNYTFRNIAPSHTTLGRMRRTFGGFRSPSIRA